MQYYFFTIPARDSGMAAQELNQFCSQNRVVTVDKQFVAEGGNSYWFIVPTLWRGNAVSDAPAS